MLNQLSPETHNPYGCSALTSNRRRPPHRIRITRRKFQQLPRGTGRLRSALFPVFQRAFGHAQSLGKFGLRQAGLRAGSHGLPARAFEDILLFNDAVGSFDAAVHGAIFQGFIRGLAHPFYGAQVAHRLQQLFADVVFREPL